MKNEVIKIKCPECGAVLRVMKEPGIENKNVVCPICKKKHMFTDFKQYEHRSEEKTNYEPLEKSPGKLLYNDTTYQLSEGINTIGRKAPSSEASIQIETADKRMSRVHVEIRYEKGIHFFKILSPKNETYVNGQLIKPNDELILTGGETLRLADTEIRFISNDDSDRTVI